jgi:4-alpha-glucanotransferase
LLEIDDGYWDIWGRYHATSDETRRAIVRAIGVEEGSTARRGLLPHVMVRSISEPAEIEIDAPTGETARITLLCEDGSVHEFDARLSERVPLPVALPLGYHQVRVRVGSEEGAARYIVAPDRAWSAPPGRTAGICVSLYGVRSERNWGCGDFRDLHGIIDWAARDLGASFVGLNPLHAIHNRRPFNTSPYLPLSIFYQNFLYLDVESIEDFQRSRRARALRERPEIAREIAELRAAPFVEYERVSALKLRFLKLAFVEFLRCPRPHAFTQYCDAEGALLEKFATYCALDETMHQRDPEVWLWTQWPEPYHDPESDAVREFRKKHWRRILFYQYLQWQIDRQLAAAQQYARERGLPLGLYHDLALATDRFGSDLWAHREFYVAGCRVGSPPDDFSPQGQDWAFPPPNSERHREDGYRLFAESIRKNCRHGGALRIDHVMRLFRLFWIPDDMEAASGTYVREHGEDLVRILALESVRNQVTIVGEDLGTVEPAVRETLARFGILSYRLFYFEKDAAGEFKPPDAYPPSAVVSTTTHDLPTLAGFWLGADIEARRNAGLIDEQACRAQQEARRREKQKMLDALFRAGLMREGLPRDAAAYAELTDDLHHAALAFLARTPAALLALNQEDLTREIHQQNLPGSTWQYPNWGRKMRYTVEQLISGTGYTTSKFRRE